MVSYMASHGLELKTLPFTLLLQGKEMPFKLELIDTVTE